MRTHSKSSWENYEFERTGKIKSPIKKKINSSSCGFIAVFIVMCLYSMFIVDQIRYSEGKETFFITIKDKAND